jgi:predicted ester cyclase
MPDEHRDGSRNAIHARLALEDVCSGAQLDRVADYYHPDFVDHVNGKTYHGHQGVRESVHIYQRILTDLRFEVVQQITEGGNVASRFIVHGTNRGRRIRLTGIVVSRLHEGRIVEDFAVTDTVELLRQLGWWRTVLLVATQPQVLRH